MVYPSTTLDIRFSAATLKVSESGSFDVGEQFIKALRSPAVQSIAAAHGLRPASETTQQQGSPTLMSMDIGFKQDYEGKVLTEAKDDPNDDRKDKCVIIGNQLAVNPRILEDLPYRWDPLQVPKSTTPSKPSPNK
jgi:hypothetical protein